MPKRHVCFVGSSTYRGNFGGVVTAHVEEGAQLSLLVPHHHVGFPQQLACEVLPSVLHLLGPPHCHHRTELLRPGTTSQLEGHGTVPCCQPRWKTRGASLLKTSGLVYQEAGGVVARSMGTWGSHLCASLANSASSVSVLVAAAAAVLSEWLALTLVVAEAAVRRWPPLAWCVNRPPWPLLALASKEVALLRVSCRATTTERILLQSSGVVAWGYGRLRVSSQRKGPIPSVQVYVDC